MKRMKRSIVLEIVLFCALVASQAQAGEACSEATLEGPYGFHTHGVARGGEQLFAGVGVINFDGEGGMEVRVVTSRDGQIRHGTPFPARYSVNADCTGTIDGLETGGNLQDIVIVDGGNEIRSLVRQPSEDTWTAVYKKQNVSECTAANMAGNWGYSFQGSILRDESFLSAAIIGLATFDGAGRVTGTELRNVGGELVTLSIDTTYTVASDCTGETNGLSYFVLVGDGSESFLIRTIDGWVVTGFPKRQ